MEKYEIGGDVGALEPWDFDDPRSDYVIVEGTPRVSGRLDRGGPGHVMRGGIWRCTAGTFECTELGHELMTVLSGRCRLHDLKRCDGQVLGPGDSVVIEEGQRVRWEVSEEITKVFLAYRESGF